MIEIIESLRLEWPPSSPNPTFGWIPPHTLNPIGQCHVHRVFGTEFSSMDEDCSCALTFFQEGNFLITNLSLPWHKLKPFSPCPFTSCMGEEADPYFATTSFYIVLEGNKVSLKPSFVQIEQPWYPQPLLIRPRSWSVSPEVSWSQWARNSPTGLKWMGCFSILPSPSRSVVWAHLTQLYSKINEGNWHLQRMICLMTGVHEIVNKLPFQRAWLFPFTLCRGEMSSDPTL